MRSVFHVVLCIALLCVVCTSASRAIANDIAERLNVLGQQSLCSERLQEQYSPDAISETTVDGADLLSSVVSSVSNNFNDKLDALKALRDSAEKGLSEAFLYDNREEPYVCNDVIADYPLPAFKQFVNPEESCARVPYYVDSSDPDVMRAAAGTSNMLEVMQNNLKQQPTLLWQYFGSTSAYFRTYPARVENRHISYDPRYRPWFLKGVGRPKAVVLVIDTSGSMSGTRIVAAKQAATIVLAGLNAEDWVAAIGFDSVAVVLPQTSSSYSLAANREECFADQALVPASAQNIESFTKAINRLNAAGGTDFTEAMETAFDVLISAPASARLEDRDIAILFLTDGDGGDPSAAVASAQQRLPKRAKLYSYALGSDLGSDVLQRLRSLSNNNGGVMRQVSLSTIAETMAEYYTHPDLVLPAADSQFALAQPYIDSSGLGLVSTLSLGVYVDNQLTGVVGIDFSMSDVLSSLKSLVLGPHSYAFLVHRDGTAISHPLLPTPESLGTSGAISLYVNISQLETDANFQRLVVPPLLAGQTGSVRIESSRVLSRGDDSAGGTVLRTPATAYYQPLRHGLPYRLCLVIADSDVIPLTPKFEGEGKPVHYHLGDWDSRPASVVKLASHAFKQPFIYEQNGMCDGSTTSLVYQLEQQLAGQEAGCPPLVQEAAYADVQLTASIDSCWAEASQAEYSSVLARYVGTRSGVMRVSPAMQLAQSYDPAQRPWYVRAVASPNKWTVSTYEDAFTGQMVTTLSKALFYPASTTVAAVMGSDVLATHMLTLLDAATDGSDLRPALVDESGHFVVFRDRIRRMNVGFLSTQEQPMAGFLMARGVLREHECVDFTSAIRRRFYTLNTSLLPSHGMHSGCGSAYPVPGYNLALLMLPDPAVSCSVPDDCATQCFEPSFAVRCFEEQNCACPCIARANYNQCVQRYSEGSLPSCPSPVPPATGNETNNCDSNTMDWMAARCERGLSSDALISIIVGVLLGVAFLLGYLYNARRRGRRAEEKRAEKVAEATARVAPAPVGVPMASSAQSSNNSPSVPVAIPIDVVASRRPPPAAVVDAPPAYDESEPAVDDMHRPPPPAWSVGL